MTWVRVARRMNMGGASYVSHLTNANSASHDTP
jgi:hypothetical protein